MPPPPGANNRANYLGRSSTKYFQKFLHRKVSSLEHSLIETIKYGSKIFTEPDLQKIHSTKTAGVVQHRLFTRPCRPLRVLFIGTRSFYSYLILNQSVISNFHDFPFVVPSAIFSFQHCPPLGEAVDYLWRISSNQFK